MTTHTLFLPSFEQITPQPDIPLEPFQWSTCSAADLLHPEFARICKLLGQKPAWHRKLWEWTYIVYHLNAAGLLRTGSKGLCFGVGNETLPAYFASRGSQILATDAPSSIGEAEGWRGSGQHIESREALFYPEIVARAEFDRLVAFSEADMNQIPQNIRGFDFCWSSCCFEHLGSISKGIDFVVNSVEKTLISGGMAVHTTEFNLSSNSDTIETGGTVIFRKRDIEELVKILRDRGHETSVIKVAPDTTVIDGFVDIPPYTHNPHLKLQLDGYVTTSIGIIVRRK
jgi:hypothetical protein